MLTGEESGRYLLILVVVWSLICICVGGGILYMGVRLVTTL